jgi:ABC-type sugar transport system ATPase subunit
MLHDQEEVLAVFDGMVVTTMRQIAHVGTPADLYINPANLVIANSRAFAAPGLTLALWRENDPDRLSGCGGRIAFADAGGGHGRCHWLYLGD